MDLCVDSAAEISQGWPMAVADVERRHFRIPKKLAILGSDHFWSRYRVLHFVEVVPILKLCVFQKTSFPTAGNIRRTSSSHALPPHVVPHPGRQRVHRSSRCQPELFKTYSGDLIASDMLWYVYIYYRRVYTWNTYIHICIIYHYTLQILLAYHILYRYRG